MKHWDDIYQNNKSEVLSWFQTSSTISLALIKKYLKNRNNYIIDVGSGSSHLSFELSREGYKNIFVSDISAYALKRSRSQFVRTPKGFSWHQLDVTKPFHLKKFNLWHDRAVFHFLREEREQLQYKNNLLNNIEKTGIAVISTFSIDGPIKCSGLEVVRYNEGKILQVFGKELALIEKINEMHFTPNMKKQSFSYFILKKIISV